MDDRRGVLWREPASDPSVAERFVALERVQQARRALDQERARAEAAALALAIAAADGTDGTETTDHDPADIAHLLEIHGALEAERRPARRPFAKRNERDIMAFEMAERLVLDRLGYASYADFEANHHVDPAVDEVIDLIELTRLEHELAAAEADLSRVTVSGHAAFTPPPLPRRERPSATGSAATPSGRTTSARKEVFGTSSGWAPDRRARPTPRTPVTPADPSDPSGRRPD